MTGFLHRLARRLPFLGPSLRELDTLRGRESHGLWVPPGHYASPIASAEDIRKAQQRLDPNVRELPGIDLNEAGQLALLAKLARRYPEVPWGMEARPPLRYRFQNDWFPAGDAVSLYGMLRELEPRRYVEIGSGWSSAAALDVNDRFFGGRMQCTFIEPFPDRLRSLLTADDTARVRVFEQPLQDVGLEPFQQLEAGDVVFIDSSHVSKFGSDVNYELFEILPRLRPGVHVHVHDVFHPFEYPMPWVHEGRNWTEAYMLRAFLTGNPHYQIVLFNDFLARFHGAALQREMPSFMINPGGSIWLARR